MAGINIATKIPNSATPFWWWEDFKLFTDVAHKKTYHDFGLTLSNIVTEKTIQSARIRRKVIRPSKEELSKLIWSKPLIAIAKDFGVSDKAIKKWIISYEIVDKPPIGYWVRKTTKVE